MANADILIVEDDAVLREVYTKKFTISGYTIRTPSNGEEAIAEMQKKEPDILILDINMPILDGFGVLEKYPKEGRKFPIIMLTNFGDEKNRDRGKLLGADDFFIKSEMTIRKLLEMVETLLKAKQYWADKQ
jgi:DNA-binding response OmpR family regulator